MILENENKHDLVKKLIKEALRKGFSEDYDVIDIDIFVYEDTDNNKIKGFGKIYYYEYYDIDGDPAACLFESTDMSIDSANEYLKELLKENNIKIKIELKTGWHHVIDEEKDIVASDIKIKQVW